MKRFPVLGHWACFALLALVAMASSARASANYANAILADMPIGYWPLGESNTQAIAADMSLTGWNGIYSRGVTSGVPGPIKNSPDTGAAFDGMTSYVDFYGAAANPYNLANGFTLEAWVINAGPIEGASTGRIFDTRILPTSPTAGGYGFGVLSSNNQLRFTTYGILDYDSNVVVPVDGKWHYVAVVFDSSNAANFYLDGTLQQSIPGNLPAAPSPSPLNIGRAPVANGNQGKPPQGYSQYWNGSISEAAIYNYELTSSQIAGHYSAGISP
jgi:hypothetical protein